jgi:hypothetical protein
MTYREAFDATGKPRKLPSLRRHYRRVLMRWMGVVAVLLAWAHLVSYLDTQKW